MFFQQGLILYDGPIKFYEGSLTPADNDNNGMLSSIGISKPKPVSATMQIIRKSINTQDENLMPERSPIKNYGMSYEELVAMICWAFIRQNFVIKLKHYGKIKI